MSKLIEEVQEWNSPTVGAYLLWKFTLGYFKANRESDAPVALLHFMAIPLLKSSNLIEGISDRRPDLQSYIRGFESKRESDLLVSIHERVLQNRLYTMQAIDIAVSTSLLFWDYESGKLYPKTEIKKPRRGNNLKYSLVKYGNKSEILGKWFSQHSVTAIAAYLKVVL